ncbi:hypothetical protein [Pseudomonas savastanoi]|uniref:hypothetical protein n=1 Tax=Pseudomonas savastanoi TaxID=29438 RepID=UPI000EFE9E9C|nr:hypothetical protein [Pseudomonas savastanoi]
MTKTKPTITKYEKLEKKAVLAVNAAFPPFINRLEWPIKKSCSYRNYTLSPYSDEKTFFTSLERKLKLYVQTNKIWKLFLAHTRYEDKTAFLNATDPLILAIKQNTPESLQLQSLRLLNALYGIDRTHLFKLLETGDRDKARLLHVSGDLVYDAFNTQDVETHVSRVITALSTPKIQKYRPRAKPVKGEPIQLIARGSPAQLYMEFLCVDEIERNDVTRSVISALQKGWEVGQTARFEDMTLSTYEDDLTAGTALRDNLYKYVLVNHAWDVLLKDYLDYKARNRDKLTLGTAIKADLVGLLNSTVNELKIKIPLLIKKYYNLSPEKQKLILELDSKAASVIAGNLGVRLYFCFCEARLLSNIDLIIKEVRAKQIRGH